MEFEAASLSLIHNDAETEALVAWEKFYSHEILHCYWRNHQTGEFHIEDPPFKGYLGFRPATSWKTTHLDKFLRSGRAIATERMLLDSSFEVYRGMAGQTRESILKVRDAVLEIKEALLKTEVRLDIENIVQNSPQAECSSYARFFEDATTKMGVDLPDLITIIRTYRYDKTVLRAMVAIERLLQRPQGTFFGLVDGVDLVSLSLAQAQGLLHSWKQRCECDNIQTEFQDMLQACDSLLLIILYWQYQWNDAVIAFGFGSQWWWERVIGALLPHKTDQTVASYLTSIGELTLLSSRIDATREEEIEASVLEALEGLFEPVVVHLDSSKELSFQGDRTEIALDPANGSSECPYLHPNGSFGGDAPARSIEMLNVDATGILRGPCRQCGERCGAWLMNDCTTFWLTSQERIKPLPKDARERCDRCNCRATEHVSLLPSMSKVKACIDEFRNEFTSSRHVPQNCKLPQTSLSWNVTDIALYILTMGKFDPEKHGRREPHESGGSRPLISVCVPTSEKRHIFHPLVYENFMSQSYEPKELVIVDCAERPSEFIQGITLRDARVIYRHFQVEDATCEQQGRFPLRTDTWSLGFKRNLCCHLSRGAILAHFDDDDLYSSDYLDYMCTKLLSSVQEKEGAQKAVQASKGQFPTIATLSEWHMMDIHDQLFRYMDPKTESMPEDWREGMIYGYGFSYMFTRAAWCAQRFPDCETAEDDVFMTNLWEKNTLTTLVELPSHMTGLAAHTFHAGCASGGEWNGKARCGYVVETPPSFLSLLPIVRDISAKLPRGGIGLPPSA